MKIINFQTLFFTSQSFLEKEKRLVYFEAENQVIGGADIEAKLKEVFRKRFNKEIGAEDNQINRFINLRELSTQDFTEFLADVEKSIFGAKVELPNKNEIQTFCNVFEAVREIFRSGFENTFYKSVSRDIRSEVLETTPEKSEILLNFQGAITQNIVTELEEFSEGLKNKGLVRHILIEIAQNIEKYSSDMIQLKDKGEGVGNIVVIENNDVYIVRSGNLIEKKKEADFTERCDKINQMNAEELKQAYKKQSKIEVQKGQSPGLGLIDMARKSGNKLNYELIPADEDNSILILSVTIPQEKKKKRDKMK